MISSHSSSPYFPCLDCNIAFYCITDLEAHIGNDHSDLFIPQSPWAELLFWQNLLDEGTAQTGNNCVCLNANIITCKSNIKVVFNIFLSSFPGRTSWKKGLLEPKLHLCAWTRPSSRANVSQKKSISSLSWFSDNGIWALAGLFDYIRPTYSL